MRPLVSAASNVSSDDPLVRLCARPASRSTPTSKAAASVLARVVRRATAPPETLPELPLPSAGPAAGGYWAARSLLEAAGVWLSSARQVYDLDQARQAARELGYPVVLKAASLEHKSDAGGVVLDLADDAALERAATDMWWRLGPEPALGRVDDPEPRRRRVARRRASRPPVRGDRRRRARRYATPKCCPTSRLRSHRWTRTRPNRLIRSLQGAPLLLGARGRPPLDVVAAAKALVAISKVAAGYPAIAEIEVNPLLVCRSGAYGLDARLVLESDGADTSAAVRRPANRRSGCGG